MSSAESSRTCPFVPVLLGTEACVYVMARSFYEYYGVSSVAYGVFPLIQTAHSKFIEVRCDPAFTEPDRFVEVLNGDVARLAGKPALLIPCGDNYTELLSHTKHRLDPAYRCVCPEPELVERVLSKTSFYEMCENYGAPYPATLVLDSPEVPAELPFGFPVALKPDDGVSYRAHHFEGQKKAYVISERPALEETVRRIYASGYNGKLIVQDFIPGGDDNMRVVNGYVRADGTVSLIALGHPLLEDYSPMAIGNYAAIIAYGDDELYRTIEDFVSRLGYHGFFNMDMKYDPRDGSYRFFELNPRHGRSSFYVTLAGNNLARFVVEDYLDIPAEPVRAHEEALWVGVPHWIVRRFVAPGPDRDRALALMRAGKVGTTLFGAGDRDPRRLIALGKLWLKYCRDYLTYFGKRDLDAS